MALNYATLGLLAVSSSAFAQSVPGATFFRGGGVDGSPYRLVDDYTPAQFFDKFNFAEV